MELMLSIVGALGLAILGALLGAQANGSARSIARWIVRLRVRRLPESLRERYQEEWAAVIEDVQGPLLKITTALGLLVGVGAVVREHTGRKLAAQKSTERA